MSLPATHVEGLYRNRIEQVSAFLELRHPQAYWVFNLCSERQYPTHFFGDRVSLYPVDDHNVPTLAQMFAFTAEARKWLRRGAENVVAVHCKGGKGRTGLIISALLIFSFSHDANAALQWFDRRRTDETAHHGGRQGVSGPSQRRFVHYFGALVHQGFMGPPQAVRLRLRSVSVRGVPRAHRGGCRPFFRVHCGTELVFDSLRGGGTTQAYARGAAPPAGLPSQSLTDATQPESEGEEGEDMDTDTDTDTEGGGETTGAGSRDEEEGRAVSPVGEDTAAPAPRDSRASGSWLPASAPVALQSLRDRIAGSQVLGAGALTPAQEQGPAQWVDEYGAEAAGGSKGGGGWLPLTRPPRAQGGQRLRGHAEGGSVGGRGCAGGAVHLAGPHQLPPRLRVAAHGVCGPLDVHTVFFQAPPGPGLQGQVVPRVRGGVSGDAALCV